MRLAGRLALSGLALVAGSVAALAQPAVISARSGLIHYVEGQVSVADQAVDSKFGTFPEVKENQTLTTEEGRAEVLLTPGVFLRLGENSSFRMVTNRLIDTRLEFLSGSAIIEAEDMAKDNSVTVVFGEATIHVAKKGLYRFDSSPAELHVFTGLAEVTSGDQTIEVKDGHMLALDTLAMRKFDKNETDALNRWSERRAEYVSMANVSAANTLRTSLFSGDSMLGNYGTSGLYGNSMFGANGMFMGGWYFNPFFGMYTFVPGMGNGMAYSPYGFTYWSPYNVYQAYLPGYYYYPGTYGNGYGGAYGSGYKSVPTSTGAGSIRSGTGSLASAGHGPSRGTSGGASSGSVSVGRGTGLSGGSLSGGISHGASNSHK